MDLNSKLYSTSPSFILPNFEIIHFTNSDDAKKYFMDKFDFTRLFKMKVLFLIKDSLNRSF
jgi:hypothetical protein